MNAYLRLRQACLATSTRPFLARGRAVVRCERCQLGRAHCICAYRSHNTCPFDWVLLMHRDEVFKPTNTGRLIADTFPDNTLAFEWSRTEPCKDLLDVLTSEARQCVIAFPPQQGPVRPQLCPAEALAGKQRLTVIVPDGTWKQAAKMVRASPYLHGLPLLALTPEADAGYALRQAARTGQLSTAEAGTNILRAAGQTELAQLLAAYFVRFNEAYAAMRGRTTTESGA